MTDKNKEIYRKIYKAEFDFVNQYCEKNSIPAIVTWSNYDYEAFRLVSGGTSLCFYPHKTSTGNHHIRVRDTGSKDKVEAAMLMKSIHIAHGGFCTFSQKMNLK